MRARRVLVGGMIKVGLDAEFVEHEDTSDAEEIFLLDSVLPVAAIEFVGDLTYPTRNSWSRSVSRR